MLLVRRHCVLVFVGFRSGVAVAVELAPFHVLGQGIDPIEREAERLADVADGALGAVGDDDGRHAGPLAAVLVVEVLQHFLAPLVLEIDVDVGRLVPLGADEPLEEHVDATRDRRSSLPGNSRRPSSRLSRGPGTRCRARGQNARGPRRSENTLRTAASRSAPARAPEAAAPCRECRRDSARCAPFHVRAVRCS